MPDSETQPVVKLPIRKDCDRKLCRRVKEVRADIQKVLGVANSTESYKLSSKQVRCPVKRIIYALVQILRGAKCAKTSLADELCNYGKRAAIDREALKIPEKKHGYNFKFEESTWNFLIDNVVAITDRIDTKPLKQFGARALSNWIDSFATINPVALECTELIKSLEEYCFLQYAGGNTALDDC